MDEQSARSYREMHHRCINDLQMVVALLKLHAARSTNDETASALLEIASRVDILARARRALAHPGTLGIEPLLRSVCEALEALATPRDIAIELDIAQPVSPMNDAGAMAAGIAVNELATNALKHAFAENGGTISIKVSWDLVGEIRIVVEDDGAAFRQVPQLDGAPIAGFGLNLARRTIEAQQGLLIFPEDGSKRFEIRLPLDAPPVLN